MKKIALSCLALSILGVSNITLAAESAQTTYRVKIPLEISNGGRLPNGTIIIGGGTNTGGSTGGNNGGSTGGNNGGNTGGNTNGNTDCYFSIDDSHYYAEIYENGNLVHISKFYNANSMSNGVKGKTKQVMEEGNEKSVISEICFNGEAPVVEATTPIVIGPPIEVPTTPPTNNYKEWKSGECRFGNGYNDGYSYGFTQVSGSDEYAGKQLFTDAAVGSWGTYHYTDSGYKAPAGAVNTDYGQYQNGDDSISKGSVYFWKGDNLKSTSTDSSGRTVYNYDVCLHITI